MPRSPNRPDAVDELPRALDGDAVKGRQLRTHLLAMLDTMAAGMLLPSERVLADRLGVARGTVRTQLDALVSEGLVRRVQGRGTFVAEPRVSQTQQMSGFSRDMLARGLRPSSRTLSLTVEPSDETVAERLDLRPGDPIVALVRIRFADDEPMALEHTHLSAARFPGLADRDLDSESLYLTLERDYDCAVDNASQRVTVLTLTAEDAELLGTTAGSPAFDIERLTRDGMGSAVEWGHSVLRGDRYDILMHVQRDLLLGHSAGRPAGRRHGHRVTDLDAQRAAGRRRPDQ